MSRRHPLWLECLESRLAPANFTVTTISDDPFHQGLSLRDAITAADSSPGSTIVFQQGLAGTISLQQGELSITTSMSINGPGNGTVAGDPIAVSARNLTRVFDITNPDHVTIKGLTIKDGHPPSSSHGGNGGGVYDDNASSSVVLDHDYVELNHAPGNGGGVYAQGSLTLIYTTLENNIADLNGGGAWAGKALTLANSVVMNNRAVNGGGLFEHDTGTTVTLTDSHVDDNIATGNGGGIWAEFNVDATRSTVNHNTGTLNGGGIYSEDGNVTLTTSHADRNVSSQGSGGGIWADHNVTLQSSSSADDNRNNRSGGGIYSEGGVVRLVSSTASRNSANGDSGGGIWALYDVFLSSGASVVGNTAYLAGGGINSGGGSVSLSGGSSVNGNVAVNGNGGGIWASYDVTVNASTVGTVVAPNSAGTDGGGIYSYQGNVYLTGGNAVVSGNTAGRDGGGIWGSKNVLLDPGSSVTYNTANDDGGGIYVTNFESLVIDTSTVSYNTAGNEGGGVFAIGFDANGEDITIVRSTFAGNLASFNGGGLKAVNVENISIDSSTFMGNTAASGVGGALDVRGQNTDLYIVNSTFGGIYSDGTLTTPNSLYFYGGAIYLMGPTATLNHVTFNDNLSYGDIHSGSAIFADYGSNVYLQNTLVDDTNHISGVLGTDLLDKGSGGNLYSMGHNLVSDFSFLNVTNFDSIFGDIGAGVQNLGPLQNNGGPTFTYALVPGGQAIGNGDNSGPFVDQRGLPRPFDSSDIGSYQTQ